MSRFALAVLVVHGIVVTSGVLAAATVNNGADLFVAIIVLIVWSIVAVALTSWLGQQDWILPEPEDLNVEIEEATT